MSSVPPIPIFIPIPEETIGIGSGMNFGYPYD